jgi:transcription initiation factor TFIIB
VGRKKAKKDMTSGARANSCFACHSTDVVTDTVRGELICRGCGEVLGDRLINTGMEWRIFADDDKGNSQSQIRAGVDNSQMFGTFQTVFEGGTTESRNALMRAQLQSEDQNELKVLKQLSSVTNLITRLKLNKNINVSLARGS